VVLESVPVSLGNGVGSAAKFDLRLDKFLLEGGAMTKSVRMFLVNLLGPAEDIATQVGWQ
jgi:hypothetical protein